MEEKKRSIFGEASIQELFNVSAFNVETSESDGSSGSKLA